ncbi:hypothetical protein ALC53_01443 [Atta colombica]|uniref:Uncharacterized protein n=1 Tax=Atta colombica TaxID=520822 RepID=A0A195BVK6_9HYME|nr:hypothetical protein ALC53_01443 [Atta colombica]
MLHLVQLFIRISYMRANISRYEIRDYIHYIVEYIFKKIYDYDKKTNAFFEIMNQMYSLDNIN